MTTLICLFFASVSPSELKVDAAAMYSLPKEVVPMRERSAGERLIRHSHAVPPLGWRRTAKGWEYMTPERFQASVLALRSPPWFTRTDWLRYSASPVLIALGMLLSVACASLDWVAFFKPQTKITLDLQHAFESN